MQHSHNLSVYYACLYFFLLLVTAAAVILITLKHGFKRNDKNPTGRLILNSLHFTFDSARRCLWGLSPPPPPMLACVSAHVHVLGECLQRLEATVTCQAARSASLCPPICVFLFLSGAHLWRQTMTPICLLSRQLAYQDRGYLVKWRMSEAFRLSLAVCSFSLTHVFAWYVVGGLRE